MPHASIYMQAARCLSVGITPPIWVAEGRVIRAERRAAQGWLVLIFSKDGDRVG